MGKRLWKGLAVAIAVIMMMCGCSVTSESGQGGAGAGQAGGTGSNIADWDKNMQVMQKDINDLKEGEKYQITLGWNENLVTQLLNAAMVEFNKTNPYYEVVIQHYDWQTGQGQLEMELAMGKGPDLFDMEMVYANKLAEKGLIEDLSDYLSDGQSLERENVVESVLRCNTIDGVLTCVPARFYLEIMLGKKSLIGDKSSWTVDEFLTCVEENEGMQIANGIRWFRDSEADNQYSIIEAALHADVEHFIDKEKNQAMFDNEEFRNILNFAKRYEADSFDYNTDKDFWLQVKDEELLLCQNCIDSVEDYMLSLSVLGQEAQYIGYPTYDGRTCYGISNYVACGMNPNSQVKEGAWAFIEFLVQYRFEEVVYEHGLFSEKSGLEEQFSEAMVKEYTVVPEGTSPIELPKWNIGYGNGQVIAEAYAATQEDIDALKELIDGASYIYNAGSNCIYTIVQAEVGGYLNGDKSVEETVDIIQNRVQLYLDEQQ